MVVCNRCRKREATRQTAMNINGRTVYMAICDRCFEEITKESMSTESLNQFSRDLTELAKEDKLDPVIGRDNEIDRVIHILSRRTKNNPVLIGEPGVGKTAIVEGLAQKIVENTVPEPLREKRLVSLDLASLLAGTVHRGSFEKRIKEVIEEVMRTKGQVILFIDEVHSLVGAGSAQGSMDAANILKPYLSRGEIQLIGATTLKEYTIVEKDAALERRFQQVYVEEPNSELTKRILIGLKDRYEDHHKIKILEEAIDEAIRLSTRYIPDKFQPDKAIDLIDEAGAALRLELSSMEPENLKNVIKEIDNLQGSLIKEVNEPKRKEIEKSIEKLKVIKKELTDLWVKTKLENVPVLTAVHVAAIVAKMTGIPLNQLTQDEKQKLINLEKKLSDKVVGQDDAISVVSQSIRRARAGIKSLNKPIGVFMFLGPTGVGKTQLAKTLAETLYGSEDFLIRVDMSEFNEKHNVSRLIGAPPGYIGYDEGGQLTEKVRRRPFSIVLFDEIEKAHSDIYNSLLQIMDDGRMTDGQGRTVNFKNTIIIMTSNVGSELLKREKIGFTELSPFEKENISEAHKRISVTLNENLKSQFKPEFLNRIDDIIIFKPLSEKAIEKIVDIQIAEVTKLLAENGIKIKLSSKAKKYLIEKGYDLEMGARPMSRLIQKEIENKLSNMIIQDEIKNGDSVKIDHNGKDIEIKVESKVSVS